MSIESAALLAVVSFFLGFGLCYVFFRKKVDFLDEERARTAKERL